MEREGGIEEVKKRGERKEEWKKGINVRKER